MKSKAIRIVMIALVLCMPGVARPLAAQPGDHSAPDVSGKWTMTVEGSPHGATTMGLTLKQDGRNVTGTFASPHGDMPVKGEFADKKLTLATTNNGDGGEITFKAQLKDDGSLNGFLSSSMGDMTWTATRAAKSGK
jgi:hypothetical protein